MRIALLGAESTGKTRLSHDLAQALRASGRSVCVVPETLRLWCEEAGRTPRPDEQLSIAQEHERRVDAAAASGAQVVIADTTALMVAIYSQMLFGDDSLLGFALERQRGYRHTVVTGLDLPWVADGLQRDGPHVRAPVDALVRSALDRAALPYLVVYGQGPSRLANALAALGLAAQPPAGEVRRGGWQAQCERCSDPDCEHRLFSGLVRTTG